MQLVCRHAQCDLHQTTDILLRPELAAKCRQPFRAANAGRNARAECCTSDITLAEFSELCVRMDGVDSNASTVEQYLQGTPGWRTTLYNQCQAPMTHRQSIQLFASAGVKMTPELKQPEVLINRLAVQSLYVAKPYAQRLPIDTDRQQKIRFQAQVYYGRFAEPWIANLALASAAVSD